MYQHGGRDIAHLMSVGQCRRIRPQHIRSQGMARSKIQADGRYPHDAAASLAEIDGILGGPGIIST